MLDNTYIYIANASRSILYDDSKNRQSIPIIKACNKCNSFICLKFSNSLHVQWTPSLNHRNMNTRITSCFRDDLEHLSNERRLLKYVSPQTFVCFFKYCCSSSAECSQDQLHIGTPYVEVYDYFHRTYVVLILLRFHLRQVKHLQCTRNS